MTRKPIVRVVLRLADPGIIVLGYARKDMATHWTAKAYDGEGSLRSQITGPDKGYIEAKMAEWFPGVPIEQEEA